MRAATANALATETAAVANYEAGLANGKAEVASQLHSTSGAEARSLKALKSSLSSISKQLSKGLASERKLFKKLGSDLAKVRSVTLAVREDTRGSMAVAPRSDRQPSRT